MPKMIIAGGDSFVYGSELHDCKDNHGINTMNRDFDFARGHSQLTFTALLAKNYDYSCIAWPGYGNDSISRSVIAYIETQQHRDIFVIVSWTFPGRYEFRFSYDTQQITGNWYVINPWTQRNSTDQLEAEFHTIDKKILIQHKRSLERAKQLGISEFAETFYRHIGSTEYWEVYSSLKEIVLLQNYLKLNNIPYLFTCADNSILYNSTVHTDDNTINSYYNQIIKDQSNWFWFPAGDTPDQTTDPRGFYQWAVENKYPIGTTHPLESAHREATNLMQEKFNELVTQYL